jgi:hypothetical protein
VKNRWFRAISPSFGESCQPLNCARVSKVSAIVVIAALPDFAQWADMRKGKINSRRQHRAQPAASPISQASGKPTSNSARISLLSFRA